MLHERFPAQLCVRVPRGMASVLEVAATRNATNPSEYVRQALLRTLRAEGLKLRTKPGVVELAEA